MTRDNTTVARSNDASKLVRARFGPGMLLQHEDLEQVTTYTQELSRLLFRSFFGCGVVCGLVVEAEMRCNKLYVAVQPGLGLDACGDPVHVPKAQCILIGDDCEEDLPPVLWVVLCGTTKRCAPRTSMCASDEDDAPQVWTRERDGFEIRVVSEPPECACGCLGNDDDDPYTGDEPCRCVHPEDPCYADHYAGHCGCACQDCCDCECILLARITVPDEGDEPGVDHRVRRFIRPLLMRDPQARIEAQARMAAAAQARTAKKTSRKKTSRSSGSGDRARTQEES